MGLPVRMCSGPRRSMISVPDATTFPIVERPIRLSNSTITSRGKPCGNVGNGRSSTMPIISQCPVTESLPGDASAMRPYAPRASSDAPPSATSLPRPSDRRAGTLSGTRRAMLPSVLLPSSPYDEASGSAPMPTLSSTMTMTLENSGAMRRGPCGSALGMMRGEVIRHGSRRADRRDGMLEHQLVGAVHLDDHGKAVEVLDPAFELASVEKMDGDDDSIAARVVQEHVLD